MNIFIVHDIFKNIMSDKNQKTLVIVESPGKIAKLSSILGDKYIVDASVGHIIEITDVDIDNDFTPSYDVIKGSDKKQSRVQVVSKLRQLAKNAKEVILAPDEDREGEMIGWSLAYVLKLKNAKRIVFNSITKEEILNAIKNAKTIDMSMVNAQKSRSILDRIIGFELSSILQKNVKLGKSAGRVQSVVTRLIVDQEKKINDFYENDINSCFKINSVFEPNMKTTLYKYKNKQKSKGDIAKIGDKKKTEDIMKLICDCKTVFKISDIDVSECTRSPSPPFTTSTLQQEASRFGFSVKSTMSTAQKLYENGLITYMRTDSVNLSSEALQNAEDFILKNFGKKYHNKINYNHKKKNTQEAHEAVRPTDLFMQDISKVNKIGASEMKLYDLIWRRTVASQMSPEKIDKKTVHINISTLDEYFFMATTEKIKFDGFLKVYKKVADDENDDDIVIDNNVKTGDELILQSCMGTQEYDRPDTRFTEASLIKRLDPKELNIGRPSTYASIINIIFDRKYVEKKNIDGIEKPVTIFEFEKGKKIKEKTKTKIIGQENNKIVPTASGKLVTEFLVKNFPEIMDYKFTARMETELDDIAHGTLVWNVMLSNFYKDFQPLIIKNTANIKPDDNHVQIGTYHDEENDVTHNIIATVGPHGPYLKMGKLCASISEEPEKFKKKNKDIQKIVELIEAANEFPKELGKHDRKKVVLHKGRNGFYFTVGVGNIKENFSINNDDEKFDPKIFSLEDAKNIIDEKQQSMLWHAHDASYDYSVRTGKNDSKYVMIKSRKNKKSKPMFLSLSNTIDPKNLTIEMVTKMIDEKKNKSSKPKKESSKKPEKDDDKIIVKPKKSRTKVNKNIDDDDV